jgi:hypothetical protein
MVISALLLIISKAPPTTASSYKRTRALLLLQPMAHTRVPLLLLVALKNDFAVRGAVLDMLCREVGETRLMALAEPMLHSPVPVVVGGHRREWWELRQVRIPWW